MSNTTYHAYIRRHGDIGWGRNLSATTERAAKTEARKLFGDDYRDATIVLTQWVDGVKVPVASAPVIGKWSPL